MHYSKVIVSSSLIQPLFWHMSFWAQLAGLCMPRDLPCVPEREHNPPYVMYMRQSFHIHVQDPRYMRHTRCMIDDVKAVLFAASMVGSASSHYDVSSTLPDSRANQSTLVLTPSFPG
jgi:hypothetical protein